MLHTLKRVSITPTVYLFKQILQINDYYRAKQNWIEKFCFKLYVYFSYIIKNLPTIKATL